MVSSARLRCSPATVPGMGGIGESGVLAPPAFTVQGRVIARASCCERLNHSRQRRRTRGARAQVECTSLVLIEVAGEQRAPAERAEQRPGRNRADIDAPRAQQHRCIPRFGEPAHLLLACAAELGFGNGDRQSVSVPRLLDETLVTGNSVLQRPYRFHIGVAFATISPDLLAGVELQTMIEKSLAGEVVVEAEHVRNTGSIEKTFQLCALRARFERIPPERMRLVEPSGEYVEGEPAPAIVE